MTAADAPSSDALRAPASPPEPPPITRKSKRLMSVADGSEAMLLRTTSCLQNAEKSRCLRLKSSGSRVRRTSTAITRKLAGAGRARGSGARVGGPNRSHCCVIMNRNNGVYPGNCFHNSHRHPRIGNAVELQQHLNVVNLSCVRRNHSIY